MNRSKKIGITVFLFLLGSVEARNRITNTIDEIEKDVESFVAPKKQKKSKKQSEKNKKFQVKEHKQKQDRQHKKKVMRSTSFNNISYDSSSMCVDLGVSKFSKGDTITLLDANQTAATPSGLIGDGATTDRMVPLKTKAMPIIGTTFLAHYTDIPAQWKKDGTTDGSLGLQFTFAKSKDALQKDYFDGDATTTAFRTFQDVKQFKLEVVGELNLAECENWILTGLASVGFAEGTVKDLRLYEKVNEKYYYTGQRVAPKKMQLTGGIGFDLSRKREDFMISIGYKVNWNRRQYDNLLRVEKPEVGASIANTTNYNLLANDSIRGLVKTTIDRDKIVQHAFTVGIEVDL